MRSILKHARISATLVLLIAAPAGMALASSPQSGQAAVLFNPRLQPSQMLIRAARAGVDVVRFGPAPGVLIVDMPDDGADALRRQGAWIIADPLVLGGCAPASRATLEPETEQDFT